jgi:Recombination endonuclease VII
MARPRLTDAERKARKIASDHRTRTRPEYRQRENVRKRRSWWPAHHGPSIHEWIAERLAAQDGRCYLCGEQLGRRLVVDHDHSCCPEGFSCDACRRGLACDRCNRLIGQVADDPVLLRRIADALEAVLEPARARIAAKPAQLDLLASEES